MSTSIAVSDFAVSGGAPMPILRAALVRTWTENSSLTLWEEPVLGIITKIWRRNQFYVDFMGVPDVEL
jgi:hypothetical protein